MKEYLMKKFKVDSYDAEEMVDVLIEKGIETLKELKETAVHICPGCGSIVVVGECKTDQYWTDDGDRCVYHKCYYCDSSLEMIDTVNGNVPLDE